MKHWSAIFLLLTCFPAFPAYHDTLRCYRIDSALAPVIDGDMADWPLEYKAGTFKGEYNIFCLHPTGSWDFINGFTSDYDAELYLCHTDSFFYIGWKTTVDDIVMQGHDPAQASDRLWITWSGGNRIFIFNDALVPGSNPLFDGSFNPAWIPNVTAGVHAGWGGSDLPAYEVRLKKSDIGRNLLLIGYIVEDYDGSTSITHQLGIGCMYTGNHTGTECYNANCWQDPTWFPITKFIGTLPSGIETPADTLRPFFLTVCPNPFNPAITLTLSASGSALAQNITVRIFDLSGKEVADLSKEIIQNRVVWTAAKEPSGIYLVKLCAGNRTTVRKITLLK